MLDFQLEPDHVKKPVRCEKCHMALIVPLKVTSEKDPYCMHCGHILGTSIAPSVWACDCGETVLDHGGDRPHCVDCEVPMICHHAQASRVHGLGVDTDLDLGLVLLIEAQEAALQLGSDILRDLAGPDKE